MRTVPDGNSRCDRKREGRMMNKVREFLKTLVHYGRVDAESLMLSLVMNELDELEHLAEITLAMRFLNIEEGFLTKEELDFAEKHAVEYYRKHKKEVE
jgi:hypothetical protein